MTNSQNKLLTSAFALSGAVLMVCPGAFAQQFLEPVGATSGATGQAQDFSNATPSQLSQYAPQGNVSALTPAEIYQYEKADYNFGRTEMKLPAPSTNPFALPSTGSMLPGAPFTDATRAAVAQSASNFINVQIESRGLARSQQVLQRDKQLGSLLGQDQAKLGSNYAALQAQQQLINNQDMSLVNQNGGNDITQAQQKLMNREESDLSTEIKSLTGP